MGKKRFQKRFMRACRGRIELETGRAEEFRREWSKSHPPLPGNGGREYWEREVRRPNMLIAAGSSSSAIAARDNMPVALRDTSLQFDYQNQYKDFHGNSLSVVKVDALDDEGLLECYLAWIEVWPQEEAECFKKQMKWGDWFLELVVKVCVSGDKESQEDLLEKVSDQLLIVWAAEKKLITEFLPQYASLCGSEVFAQIAVMACGTVQTQPSERKTRRMVEEAGVVVGELFLVCSEIPRFAVSKIASFAGRHIGLMLESQKEFPSQQRPKNLPKNNTTALAPRENSFDTIPVAEPVIEDVVHGEPAAHIPPEEAAILVETNWASWLQHNADAKTTTHQRSVEESQFEPVYMLCIARATKDWQERLHTCSSLESLRAALNESGHDVRLPSGAALLVAPGQYAAVRQLLAREGLRPWHVVVSESLLPLVLDVVHDMPCRSNTRVRSANLFAYMENCAGESSVAVTIEKTFLSIPRPTYGSIVQSTGDAHGVQNPRRIIPTMAVSDA